MQFKHPEILWALFLLLIPIFIHLFQLRRFKKTPFTNVAMLQKVVSESRKSNTLKKWLLLLTRLLLLAALVIAFAQPFSASTNALQEKETVIYLDDSFSLQAKSNGLSLMEKAVQDLIKNVEEDKVFSLFTNQKTYRNVTIKGIQNNLLSLPYSHTQLNFDEILLKANTLFSESQSSIKNLILISDFQQNMGELSTAIDSSIKPYLVPLSPRGTRNIALDSVYLENNLVDQSNLKILLSGGANEESIPISLYNGATLIAKTAANFTNNGTATVLLSLPPGQEIKGHVSIQDNSLGYDNHFYFNIDEREKIKVLAISDANSDYLKRLYTPDEFELTTFSLRELNYSALDNQNVVVLNQLPSIPSGLQKVLRTFHENGGTLIMAPALESDLPSYNQFLSGFFTTKFVQSANLEKKITGISFDHPLYQGVFEKEVSNFQYPKVSQSYQVQTRAPKLLSFEGGEPFLSGIDGFYFFTSPLDLENSNFKNSPLIVPTFYNMAAFSLKMPDIYHTVGDIHTIDIPIKLGNDTILNVTGEDTNFIPLQQTFPNKVQLTFNENPTVDGIFSVDNEGRNLRNISFNYPRTESVLSYLDMNSIEEMTSEDSIAGLFETLKAENSVTAYWKWFVILALLLALLEVIIQKFVT